MLRRAGGVSDQSSCPAAAHSGRSRPRLAARRRHARQKRTSSPRRKCQSPRAASQLLAAFSRAAGQEPPAAPGQPWPPSAPGRRPSPAALYAASGRRARPRPCGSSGRTRSPRSGRRTRCSPGSTPGRSGATSTCAEVHQRPARRPTCVDRSMSSPPNRYRSSHRPLSSNTVRGRNTAAPISTSTGPHPVRVERVPAVARSTRRRNRPVQRSRLTRCSRAGERRPAAVRDLEQRRRPRGAAGRPCRRRGCASAKSRNCRRVFGRDRRVVVQEEQVAAAGHGGGLVVRPREPAVVRRCGPAPPAGTRPRPSVGAPSVEPLSTTTTSNGTPWGWSQQRLEAAAEQADAVPVGDADGHVRPVAGPGLGGGGVRAGLRGGRGEQAG